MFHNDESEATPAGIRLSPRASFVIGLVGGALTLCTIGFVVLLSLMLKGQLPLALAANVPAAVVPTDSLPPIAPPADLPPAAAPTVSNVKPVSSDDHIRGDKNAPVTLIEYSDFQCPFCQRFHPTMQRLLKEYDGQVRWVYRHFPLSFHPFGQAAAIASECASEQGKFWEYADKLFDNQEAFSADNFKIWAGEIGLNKSKFQTCLESGKFAARVKQDLDGGSASGITGTPGTIIIGQDGQTQLVPGAVPYEQLKAQVDSAL